METYKQVQVAKDGNDDAELQILPRTGAFEVSTVIEGKDILFYSKVRSGLWPHVEGLANRIFDFVMEARTSTPE